jgi:CelD/BcsL family acetyltransferase involved in cellulose biosynthesis
MLVVETIEDTAGLQALQEEWGELLGDSSADCIFLTWEWLYTWWEYLAGDRKLHLILVRSNDQLIALAPLALRSRRWRRLLPFRALEFLGTGSVGSDYLDVIIRRGEERRALAALAESLEESGLMVDFSQTAAGSHAVALMEELKDRGWQAHSTRTDLCPYIDLQGQTWESYLAGLGSSHRYNIKRRTKNLGKEWRLSFEHVMSVEMCDEAIRSLVQLHGQRWQSRGEPGVFGDPTVIAFHHEFSRLALKRGWLRLYLLRLDGETAVVWYGFHYHGVTSFYQTGFDPSFYKHSVGLVMMGMAIKSAIEEGALTYDFLRGDETYKSLWACRERELLRLELFPPSRRGAFYRHAMELRGGIKKGFKFSSGLHKPGIRAERGHRNNGG